MTAVLAGLEQTAAVGARWRTAREPAEVAHLDAAAAARSSRAVVQAQLDHLRAESIRGAYVAQEAAEPLVAAGRAGIATMLGLSADDLTLVGSSTSAFVAVLEAWPLRPGDRVGIVATEYGSNAMALAAHAGRLGLELVDLPLDADARIDLGRFDPSGLALVAFPPVASQRGTAQPTAEVGAACAAAGVPLLLDVAQALGQVDSAGFGAAAYVGTSRKWLCGPRGVGFVAVRPDWAERLTPPWPNLLTHGWTADGRAAGPPAAGVDRLAISEHGAAARVGLAVAVAELLPDLPAVLDRIAALGAYARSALDGVAGWTVVEPAASRTGVVTLLPPAGVDPADVRDELLGEHEILTSAIAPGRAPRDLGVPALRASLHAYVTADEVDALADALPLVTG